MSGCKHHRRCRHHSHRHSQVCARLVDHFRAYDDATATEARASGKFDAEVVKMKKAEDDDDVKHGVQYS